MSVKETVLSFKSHLFGDCFYNLVKIGKKFYLERYVNQNYFKNSYFLDCFFEIEDISCLILLLDGFETLDLKSNIKSFKITEDYFEFDIQNVMAKRIKISNDCIPKFLKVLRICEYIIKKNFLKDSFEYKRRIIVSTILFFMKRYVNELQLSTLIENNKIKRNEYIKIGDYWHQKIIFDVLEIIKFDKKKIIYIIDKLFDLFSFEKPSLKEEEFNNYLYGQALKNYKNIHYTSPVLKEIISIVTSKNI